MALNRKRALPALLLLAVIGGGTYYAATARPAALVLTGIVTTHEVIVSSQVAGKVSQLLVGEGDAVRADQALAVIAPDELQADRSYYEQNVAGITSQVRESEAALRLQERQLADQVRQAESTVASVSAQLVQAQAELENARLTRERTERLVKDGVAPEQQGDQARTAFDAARAHVDALGRQVDAQKAALAIARANVEQTSVRRSQLQASEHLRAAADAQKTKADVRLGYTDIRAPLAGVVDVRAVRQGEVVTAGQPLLTLVNPDDLWVRADVEETYIDRVRTGDTLTVRLPSGEERPGQVSYRGVEAGFATQRDVSRTKRDIKTFEIRLRVDNRDRRLAVGMTAYVQLPLR